MENYSLSDIAAVTDSAGRCGGGLGLGNGDGLAYILLFALIFGRDGFFGGRGGGSCGCSGGGGGEPVTEAGLCNAMNFNNLENAVGRMSDQAQANQSNTYNAICSLGYDILSQFNALGSNVNNCCCTIQRAIDAVNYNGAMNTASINKNVDEKMQKILDYLCQLNTNNMQNRINQLELNAALAGVVRYPNGFVYSAGGSPFCGTGCCQQQCNM